MGDAVEVLLLASRTDCVAELLWRGAGSGRVFSIVEDGRERLDKIGNETLSRGWRIPRERERMNVDMGFA